MTTAVIELGHLQKNFGKLAALEDVSFALTPGQILSFLGPNEADKSMTIRVILGLLRKNNGSVTVFDKNVWRDDAAIRPRIAYVPGDVYLWPNLPGDEIIDLLLCLNGRQYNREADGLIKAFKSDPKRKARICSKDNCQKVALIATLSQDTNLYIPDEPTSGLDPLSEQTFQQEVLKLKRADKNVLLSSHILSGIGRMYDLTVVICDDSVIESGNPDQLRHLSWIKIEVATATPMTALIEQANVHDLIYRNSEHIRAVFTADRSAFGTIMTTLVADAMVDMQSTPPMLEDLLLRYYGGQGETHAAQ